MIHKVKNFSAVNEKEVDDFLKFLCFFYDPRDVGSSAFSKYDWYIWNLSVLVLLKLILKDFEHDFIGM